MKNKTIVNLIVIFIIAGLIPTIIEQGGYWSIAYQWIDAIILAVLIITACKRLYKGEKTICKK